MLAYFIADSQYSVLDVTTNSVVSNKSFGREYIQGFALSKDGTRVYAYLMKTLATVDTTSNAIIANVTGILGYSGGNSAGCMTISPDGSTVYAMADSDKGPPIVFVISLGSNQIVGRLSLGSFVPSMTASSDRLYIPSEGNTVVVMSLSGQTIRNVVVGDRFGGYAMGVLLSPTDASKAFVATSTGIVWFSTDTYAISEKIAPFPGVMAITPDGKRLYVSQPNNSTVVVISVDEWVVTDVINVNPQPTNLAVSPDGAWVYLTHAHSSGLVTIIDTTSNKVYLTAKIPTSWDYVHVMIGWAPSK